MNDWMVAELRSAGYEIELTRITLGKVRIRCLKYGNVAYFNEKPSEGACIRKAYHYLCEHTVSKPKFTDAWEAKALAAQRAAHRALVALGRRSA